MNVEYAKKNLIHAWLDKNVKANNVRELLRDVQNVHYHELAYSQLHVNSKTFMNVVHGVLRGNDSIIQQSMKQNINWMMMDNGYLGTYKRVILNATAPNTMRPGRRFEHNTKLESWKGGEGDYILILPPSPPYMDTFSARDFLNHCAHHINIYTGRPMVIRAKPAKGKLAPPLEEQIRGAYAVVTWGSAVALEAMRLGKPTISYGWCPAKPASFTIADLETDKLTQEPDRMAVFDNLTWSSFQREELPMAFDIALENAEYPEIKIEHDKDFV